jgi:putative Ca2+/H+ antiporter (TMEM165/GDT1 family)
MSLSVALTVLALIIPAELPDKTFVASLVLATRFRAVPVLVGVSLGFAVQSGIAVAAGSAFGLLPKVAVHAVSAAIFAVGAVMMLRSVDTKRREQDEEREFEDEIAEVPAEPSTRRIVLTSFVVLFVAEWGDLTQILTASLSAKYDDPAAVFVGSFVGLVLVAALAVTGGKALLRVMPLDWVRRIAAAAFAVIAAVTALEAAGVL